MFEKLKEFGRKIGEELGILEKKEEQKEIFVTNILNKKNRDFFEEDIDYKTPEPTKEEIEEAIQKEEDDIFEDYIKERREKVNSWGDDEGLAERESELGPDIYNYYAEKFSEEPTNRRNVYSAVLISGGSILKELSEEQKKDKVLFLTLMKKEGSYIQYADKELKNDKDFILKCIKRDFRAFEYINESLKKDRDFTLKCLKEKPYIYSDINNIFKEDKKFNLEYMEISEKSYGFRYFNENMKNDKDFIKAFLKNSYEVEELENMKYVKNDKDLMKLAIENQNLDYIRYHKKTALNYASEELKNDKDLIKLETKVLKKELTELNEMNYISSYDYEKIDIFQRKIMILNHRLNQVEKNQEKEKENSFLKKIENNKEKRLGR